MLHSDKFQETTIEINGKESRMEYDVAPAIQNSVRGFGNIYIDLEKDPMEFTFFTLNNQIAGYTPMNINREIISEIVEITTGSKLDFSSLLD